MTYPKIMTEADTVRVALAGMSLARYGDGELSLVLGGNCISQAYDPGISRELRAILIQPQDGLLVCIPNIKAPTKPNWAKFGEPRYTELYRPHALYGSSFVTRPDSAPWIDNGRYWADIRKLWTGRDVILVHGGHNNLRATELSEASRVKEIIGPRRDAYAAIDHLVQQVEEARTFMKSANPIVIMNLGPTATVLAARLAARGFHAIDLGHIGMFMRAQGAYAVTLDQLASPAYRALLEQYHGSVKAWGAAGKSHAETALTFLKELGGNVILDYGCGRATLAHGMEGLDQSGLPNRLRILNFDPGVEQFRGMPKPCDLVLCTDVLEHIEPDRIGNVLGHIYALSQRGAFFTIALSPSKAVLPDGRNSHLLIQPASWWLDRLRGVGFKIVREEMRKGLFVWCQR